MPRSQPRPGNRVPFILFNFIYIWTGLRNRAPFFLLFIISLHRLYCQTCPHGAAMPSCILSRPPRTQKERGSGQRRPEARSQSEEMLFRINPEKNILKDFPKPINIGRTWMMRARSTGNPMVTTQMTPRRIKFRAWTSSLSLIWEKKIVSDVESQILC